jgi:NTP pyrophosphatase (non-canonical NTP hydrolase)
MDAETHSQTVERSLETLMEELGEVFRALKRIGTPQEDEQSQLTWTLGDS